MLSITPPRSYGSGERGYGVQNCHKIVRQGKLTTLLSTLVQYGRYIRGRLRITGCTPTHGPTSTAYSISAIAFKIFPINIATGWEETIEQAIIRTQISVGIDVLGEDERSAVITSLQRTQSQHLIDGWRGVGQQDGHYHHLSSRGPSHLLCLFFTPPNLCRRRWMNERMNGDVLPVYAMYWMWCATAQMDINVGSADQIRLDLDAQCSLPRTWAKNKWIYENDGWISSSAVFVTILNPHFCFRLCSSLRRL